jgi:hypothetical protein
VVFQDGIYWINEMPNHPISMFIKGLLPLWYVPWANEQRNRIAQLEYSERTQQISRLEPASKAAFDHVNERMQAQFQHLEQRDMQREQREMQREQRDHQIHQLLQQLVNNQQAGQTAQTPRIDEGPRTSLVIAHPATPNVTNVPAAAAAVDCFGDLDELPVPIFSTMNNGLPSTFVALLGEFQRNGLGRYVGLVGRRKHWTNSEKNALSKRLYLYEQIASAAQVIGSRNGRYRDTPFAQRLELAAKALDQKHVGLTLDMALKKIKAADTNIKKRAKKSHHPTEPNETTL